MKQEEKSIRFLAIRAIAVTLLVLLALRAFDRLNVTAIGEDVPQSAVEQVINNT